MINKDDKIQQVKNEVINSVLDYAKDNEITNLTVRDISKFTTVTRRTIYRYFENRNDLLFEVYKRAILDLNDVIKNYRNSAIEQSHNSSDYFNNIHIGLVALVNALMDYSHLVKVIVECDSILKKEENIDIDKKFADVVSSMDYIVGVLRTAVSNKAINNDFDVEQLAFLIYDSFLGTVYRHIITKDKYNDRINKESVYKIVDVYWCYFQSIKL
ncbi:MAG: TetR/AcrR family transcriptional regulator [Lachnospirales bacterium]